MGPVYVLQLLFSEKSQNRINSTTTYGTKKISADLESLESEEFFYCMFD